MNIQNRRQNLATLMPIAEPVDSLRRRRAPSSVIPVTLSLLLLGTTVAFTIAAYPLWPRLYLSPVFETLPALPEFFLSLYNGDLAHWAVDQSGGNVFFYLYSFAILSYFAVYVAAMRWAKNIRPRRAHLKWALASVAAVGMVLVLAPTLFTTDIFSYVMYGRIAAAYGANPFVSFPSEFSGDPIYHLVFWKDTVSVYGPVWISLSYILMAIVPASIAPQIATFKIIAILFHLANGLLVWRILTQISPRDRLVGTIAYVWNPLLLIEFGNNGHNDGVMLFFMLLAILAIIRKHRHWPLVFLMAAILTKWVAVFVVPIYLISRLAQEPSWRDRALEAGRSLGISVVLAAGLYAPYWAGPATFTAMFDSAAVERVINSFAELILKQIADVLKETGGPDNALDISQFALKASFGAVFLFFWWRELWQARQADLDPTAASWLRTLFIYLTIACTWFWPWYIAWLMPFAAINLRSRWAVATLLFTFSGAFFYSLWPGAPLRPFEPFYDLRAIALFGPPLLYLAATTTIDRLKASLLAREVTLEE